LQFEWHSGFGLWIKVRADKALTAECFARVLAGRRGYFAGPNGASNDGSFKTAADWDAEMAASGEMGLNQLLN